MQSRKKVSAEPASFFGFVREIEEANREREQRLSACQPILCADIRMFLSRRQLTPWEGSIEIIGNQRETKRLSIHLQRREVAFSIIEPSVTSRTIASSTHIPVSETYVAGTFFRYVTLNRVDLCRSGRTSDIACQRLLASFGDSGTAFLEQAKS